MSEAIPTHVTVQHRNGCGHTFTVTRQELCGAKQVIYKSADLPPDTVVRSITCPNCDKLIEVKVPKAWCNNNE